MRLFRVKLEKGQPNDYRIELRSGYGGESDCKLYIAGFSRCLAISLPGLIKPARMKVMSYRQPPPGADPSEQTWYWDKMDRSYGVSLNEGLFSIRYGRSTMDSSTDQRWSTFLPWTQWRFIRHSLYDLQGKFITDVPDSFHGEAYTERRRLIEAQPKARFEFIDFDGEHINAICRIEEREWRFGTGWFKWLSLFRKPKVSRSLDLSFTSEVGKRKGEWKGGTVGHATELQENESVEDAFKRYCIEQQLTYVGPVQTIEISVKKSSFRPH